MRALRRLSRRLARALFSAALGDAFDWVQSVPAGEHPRYADKSAGLTSALPAANGWTEGGGFKPSAG